MTNRVKQKLQSREVAYGIWADVFEPDLIEMFGWIGFDYVFLDAEHTGLDPQTASTMIRACNVSGMVALVRVPEINPSLILRYLEVGAVGICAPHVRTPDQARALVDAVKFSPDGHRGAGSMRALRYGLQQPFPELCRQANEDTIVLALIEDVEGILNLGQILSVQGVDVVGIGSGDLSHSMGFAGRKQAPEVEQATLDAEARIAASGKPFDSVVRTFAEAEDCVRRGSLMVSLSLRHFLGLQGRLFLESMAQATVQHAAVGSADIAAQ
jgi:2-keto-3-deoxy-L-rhamnonate aldolase RhmA